MLDKIDKNYKNDKGNFSKHKMFQYFLQKKTISDYCNKFKVTEEKMMMILWPVILPTLLRRPKQMMHQTTTMGTALQVKMILHLMKKPLETK